MIVKMKKITLVVLNKYAGAALNKLRELGVVHVKHIHQPQAQGITAFEHRRDEVDKVLAIFNREEGLNFRGSQDAEPAEIIRRVKEIIGVCHERECLRKHLQELEAGLVWFDEWGDFSTVSLQQINEAGVFVKLYTVSKKLFKKIPEDKTVYILKEAGNRVCFAFISLSEQEALPFTPVEIPGANLHSLKKKISATRKQIEAADTKINEAAAYLHAIKKYRKDLTRRLEFFKVKFGMEQRDKISCLTGFCPREDIVKIRELAAQEGWGYFFQEPDNLDEVPTLIKNPRWINIVKPVFNFMGTLPGYRELDISFWFLLFFSLFFAMIIGDAGYGFVFLAITFFMRRKFKRAPADLFFLSYVLSTAAVIWGAVTGTWFGFEKIARLPFFNMLVIDKINSFADNSQTFIMFLCFFIGAIHLTFAHGLLLVRFLNSFAALAQLGWIGIVWGVFFIARLLVFGDPAPEAVKYFLPAGIILVVLFSSPQRNIIKGIITTLSDLPLKIISSFSDIISYIRLFAVGYASVMVAATVNEMAVGTGVNTVVKGFIAAALLFAGHAVNIVLGLMSVVVHGLRLNMLEFSSHLNMEWSGEEYRPFKE